MHTFHEIFENLSYKDLKIFALKSADPTVTPRFIECCVVMKMMILGMSSVFTLPLADDLCVSAFSRLL